MASLSERSARAMPGSAPVPLRRLLDGAIGAACTAGSHLMQARSRLSSLAVQHKQPGDVASELDHEVESMLRGRLYDLDPDIGFVGEEGGGALDQPRCWVVDPIDGTANFLRGYPQYAVSVALCIAGEPVVGVVHDPVRDECFAAALGLGMSIDGHGVTRLDDRRPARGDVDRSPLEALVGTVFPKPKSPRLPTYLAELGRVMPRFGGVRRSGAMTLELAYLAAGRLDAFWAHDMGPWDAAAALVLLREAGATVHARDGVAPLRSRSLTAASSPAMLVALLDALDGEDARARVSP